MENNIGTQEQKIRLALGAALLVFGIYPRKWLVALGLFGVVTGMIKYCPVKNKIMEIADTAKETADRIKSEMNNLTGDSDDTGGYRTGNPVTGSAQASYETASSITES